jgi:hypothetical protein
MQVVRSNPFTGATVTREVPVTPAQLDALMAGEALTEAEPELSEDDREFVNTGMTVAEWAAIFD